MILEIISYVMWILLSSANVTVTLNQLETKYLMYGHNGKRYYAGWRPVEGLPKPNDNDDAVRIHYSNR